MKTIFTNCSGREVLGNQHSGPVLGRDPFLAVVSQDHGGGTILSGDEFFRRLKRAEGTQDRLVGNHDEWMRRTNDMLIKRSDEHTESYFSSFTPVELHLCSDGPAFPGFGAVQRKRVLSLTASVSFRFFCRFLALTAVGIG